MKNIFKYLAIAAMSVALTGLVACDPEPEPEPEPDTYSVSSSYNVIYEGATLTPGQVIVHEVSMSEGVNDDAEVDLRVENKTNGTLSTVHCVELTEGPESMKQVPVCYGACRVVDCPYTSNPYSLEPGVDPTPLQIHLYPSFHGDTHTGTYKVTIAEAGTLANPMVFFVKFTW